MNARDILEIVTASPGIDTREIMGVVSGIAFEDMDRHTKQRVMGAVSAKLNNLRRQGMVRVEGNRPPRWWPTDTLTPSPMRGRENPVMVEHEGQTMLLAEYCKLYGLEYGLMAGRIRLGWSLHDATVVPKFGKRENYARV